MINLYFKTDALLTRKIVFCIDYLIDKKVDKIFLLKENHNINEYWLNQINKKVNLVESFSNISKDDLLFTVKENINSKNIICLNNPYYKISKVPRSYRYYDKNYKFKPKILIVSLSMYSDTYCLEVLLNKIMVNNNIKVYQEFSNETQYILDVLKNKQLLNKNMVTDIDNADVIIQHIYGEEYEQCIDLLHQMSLFAPDYIYISVDKDFNNIELIDYVKKLVCSTCCLICSPYITYEKANNIRKPVYDMRIHSDSLFNLEIQKRIEEELLDRFYIPNEIRPI